MVIILVAISLHHALETLTTEEKSTLGKQVCSFPGLIWNTKTKNSKETKYNLLDVELKDENNVVIWHDVINNSISRQKSNELLYPSTSELLAILKPLKNKIRAPVYC